MGLIDDIKDAIRTLELCSRVEIKVLVKDLILILEKKSSVIQDIIDVFGYAEQLDDRYSRKAVLFFEEEIEKLDNDLEFFNDVAKIIEIKRESV